MDDVEMTVSETETPPSNDKLDNFIRKFHNDDGSGEGLPSLEEYVDILETCTNPPIKKVITMITKLKFLAELYHCVEEFLLRIDGNAQLFFRLICALDPRSGGNKTCTLERFWAMVDDEPSCCLMFSIEGPYETINLPFKIVFPRFLNENDNIIRTIWDIGNQRARRRYELTHEQLKALTRLSGVDFIRKVTSESYTQEDPDFYYSRDILLDTRFVSSEIESEDEVLLRLMSRWLTSAVKRSCLFVQHPIEMQSNFLDLCY